MVLERDILSRREEVYAVKRLCEAEIEDKMINMCKRKKGNIREGEKEEH